jgi:hypothetical protein
MPIEKDLASPTVKAKTILKDKINKYPSEMLIDHYSLTHF